jgi:hypothetical protein
MKTQINLFTAFRTEVDKAIRTLYHLAYNEDSLEGEEKDLRTLYKFILETTIPIYNFVPPQYTNLLTCPVRLAGLFEDIKQGYLVDKDLQFLDIEAYGTLILPACYEPSKPLETLSLIYPTERVFIFEGHRDIHRFIKHTDPSYIY